MKEDHKNRAVVTEWLETQRGQRAYKAAPPAARAVNKIMRPLSKKHGGGHTGLAAHWSEIVGGRFAKISKPIRFAGGREGRTLVIEAPGPAAALIMASASQIIDKVNAVMGPGHVRHLKVNQTRLKAEPKPKHQVRGLTPSETQELQSGLENVKNPELKTALEQLGRGVITRR